MFIGLLLLKKGIFLNSEAERSLATSNNIY